MLKQHHELRAKTAFSRKRNRKFASFFGYSRLSSRQCSFFCRRCDNRVANKVMASDWRVGISANIRLCFASTGFSRKLGGSTCHCRLVRGGFHSGAVDILQHLVVCPDCKHFGGI